MSNFLSSYLVPFFVAVMTAIATTVATTFLSDRCYRFFHCGLRKSDVIQNGPKVSVRQRRFDDSMCGENTYFISIVADADLRTRNHVIFKQLLSLSDLPSAQNEQPNIYRICTISNYYHNLGCSIASLQLAGVSELCSGATDGNICANSSMVFCMDVGTDLRSITLSCGEYLLEFNAEFSGTPRNDFAAHVTKKRVKYPRRR